MLQTLELTMKIGKEVKIKFAPGLAPVSVIDFYFDCSTIE